MILPSLHWARVPLEFKGKKAANREFGALTQAMVFTMPRMKSEKLVGQPTIGAAALSVSLFYWVEGIVMDV